jgi:hypothetical protein
MKKQMNEYVVLFNNVAESSPLPATSFSETFAKWAQDKGFASDVLRTEAGPQSMNVVCTEDVARQVVETFPGAVASIRMDRENVMTIPAPLAKKTRRPGLEA